MGENKDLRGVQITTLCHSVTIKSDDSVDTLESMKDLALNVLKDLKKIEKE